MFSYFLLSFIFLIFLSLVFNSKHFLMTLLKLEAVMLLILFAFFLLNLINGFMFLMFITLSACEGALGLSILVSVSRSYSSDQIMMFNMIS